MMEIKLKQSGRIYYPHPDGTLCIYEQDGARFYAERKLNPPIILYALDDGTFAKMRLMMSDRIKFVYSRKFNSYQRGPGPITIKGHYPFFVACEKRKRPIPVYLDIDGKFYREPVHNFKERLRNKKSIPKPKKYVPPLLENIKCQQCGHVMENVKSKNHFFCSLKCLRIHGKSREAQNPDEKEIWVKDDLRKREDRELMGLIDQGFYYVRIVRKPPGDKRRVDWIGGPYPSQSSAEVAQTGFMGRYMREHGWFPANKIQIHRATEKHDTMYGYGD